MPLPHFTQLQMTGSPGGPGTLPEEPVYLNLFEITFILPTILQAQGRDPIMMLQQANSVDLDLTPAIETAEQRFKYSTRAFMKTPSKTHIDFNIKFNVNVNQQGNMVIWNTLKAWYDLVWNSQNGVVNYKSDIIGTIIVNQHDKKGVVLRRVTFQNCQIKQLGSLGLQWASTDIWSDVQADFVADYWVDEYIDGNFTITPPLIPGY
jgi:hypothetical protein